jgi:ferredoxin
MEHRRYGAPLADVDAYGADVSGAWLNRIHTFEVTPETAPAQIVHFPKSCLHCDDAPCVTVCPTGASHKRSEDGIVLVNRRPVHRLRAVRLGLPLRRARDGPGRKRDEEMHALRRPDLQRHPARGRPDPGLRAHLPLGRAAFRRFQRSQSDVSRLVAERGGIDLMPDMGTRPVNKYLPPRPKTCAARPAPSAASPTPVAEG